MKDGPFTTITVLVHKLTENAVLIEFGNEEIWIPKSQIHADDVAELEDQDVISDLEFATNIRITEWIARQKGIL